MVNLGQTRLVEITFSAGGSGAGPATWGQAAKWDVIRNLGADAARYNVSGGTPVTPGLPFGQISTLVSRLVLRHESLRTRLFDTETGLCQRVEGAGAIPVTVRQCEPAEVTETSHCLYSELQARPFEPGCLPIRVGLVEAGKLIRYVIFSMSHTASDGWGLRNLLADCTTLLAGGTLSDGDLVQPLAEATFQVSERGRRRDLAARRYWRDKLEAAPPSQFPSRAGQLPAQKFPNAVLSSPALGLATEFVAQRLEVSPSAVLLAAASVCTEARDAVFQVVVNNRFLPGMADGVNVIAQEGLFCLPASDGDFAALVRRAFGATLSAHRHAYYDKLARDRDLAAMAGPGDFSCTVNDLRGLMPILGYAKAAPMPLGEARELTTLSWPVEFLPRANVTFALDAQDAPGAVELAMTADSAVLPRPDMERFLYGMEDLVVTQALALGSR
jgi:Condensation domain